MLQREIWRMIREMIEKGATVSSIAREMGIDIDGVRRELYAFSMALRYSWMLYVEFTTDIKTPALIQLHMNAFGYFNGHTDTILYDNPQACCA